MSAAFQFDDNPCRPRHFRPPPCVPVVPDGPARRALDGCRPRLFVASMAFIMAFVVIAGRLAQVTLLPGVVTVPRIARFEPPPPPPAPRADIVDRHGRLLAATLDSPSLYANPRQILDAADAADKLAAALPGLDRAALFAKLTSGKGFIWVKRHLTPDQEYAVNQLGLPGLQFQHEERRVYPYGALLSHVVGFTGIDDNGEAGIERGLDDSLRGRREPMQLSVDMRLQYILHEELQRVVDDFTAKGGAGLDHERQYRRSPGDGVIAGFRPEPPRHPRPQPPGRDDRGAHVQPGDLGRLRNRLRLQDLHDRDGARFGRHHDDRPLRRHLSDPYRAVYDLRLSWQASLGDGSRDPDVFVEHRRGQDRARRRRRETAGISAAVRAADLPRHWS